MIGWTAFRVRFRSGSVLRSSALLGGVLLAGALWGAGEGAPPRLPFEPWSLPPADTVPSVEDIAAWFGSEGEASRGREGVRLRAGAGGPEDENRWLQLLAVMDRLELGATPEAVRAVGLAEGGDPLGGAQRLLGLVDAVDAQDPSPLIALAALFAERDDPPLAAELRVRLLESHPTAPEAAEVALRHARWLLSIDARREEGLALLGELIVERPEHPVTPEARRLFLQERTAGSPPVPSGGSR